MVVQGPVGPLGDATSTSAVIASLRAAFPDAELILSSWNGARTDGLDVDTVVLSTDPGVGAMGSNVNRQIVSSRAGIARATRRYVLKTRTDILFYSGRILESWGRYPGRAPFGAIFQERLLVGSLFTRRPSLISPYPFHPGDWVFLGRRDDMGKLFSVPLQHSAAAVAPVTDHLHRTLLQIHGSSAHLAIPEQYLWVQAMRTAGHDAPLRYWCDLTPETLVRSEVALVQNAVVLDAVGDWDMLLPKYPSSGRLLADPSLLDHAGWQELYATYVEGNLHGIAQTFVESRWRRMLEFVMAEAPAFARDETGGGGGLRNRWPMLTELALKLYGGPAPATWAVARRPGPLLPPQPTMRAGAALVRPTPNIPVPPVPLDELVPASLAYGVPGDAVVLPRFSAGIPVHERRLELLQALADRIGHDGVAVVDFPLGELSQGDRYWLNDVRRWHLGALDEIPLTTLSPLRADARSVGLIVDDFAVSPVEAGQRIWATLRRHRHPARPRRVVVDASVALRLGTVTAAAPPGWSCRVFELGQPRLAGRLDAIAIESGALVDAIVVDALSLPGEPSLREDNEAHLFVDVSADWDCLERALRLAWTRPSTSILVPRVELRDAVRRLAPGVSCHLLRSRPSIATTSGACDVRWSSHEWRGHRYESRIESVTRQLEQEGRTVVDRPVGTYRAKVTLLGPRGGWSGTPSRWLLQQVAGRGGSFPALETETLPDTLYATMATSDVVIAFVPMAERRRREGEVLVQINAQVTADDLLAGVRGWLDDVDAREAHAHRSVAPILQQPSPLWAVIQAEMEA